MGINVKSIDSATPEEGPRAAAAASEPRSLEPIWTVFALMAAIFLAALYGSLFFHPTRNAVLLLVTIGPLALRGLAALGGRLAPLGKVPGAGR